MILQKETALFNPEAVKKDVDKARLLSQLITQSVGLFRTEKITHNGGVVIFMHNKRLLEESTVVWKLSAEGMQVSTDGMRTWKAGIDSSGNATVNLLSAVGIKFDWASGGTLTLGGQDDKAGILSILDENGKEKILANKDGITLKDGTKLLSEQGLLASYIFSNQYIQAIGGYNNEPSGIADYTIRVSVSLPTNFQIDSAVLTLDTYGTKLNSPDFTGYARNIQLSMGEFWHYYNHPENIYNPMTATTELPPEFAGELNGTINGSQNDQAVRLTSNDLSSLISDGGVTVFVISSELPPPPEELGAQKRYSYIGEGFANLTVTGRIK